MGGQIIISAKGTKPGITMFYAQIHMRGNVKMCKHVYILILLPVSFYESTIKTHTHHLDVSFFCLGDSGA